MSISVGPQGSSKTKVLNLHSRTFSQFYSIVKNVIHPAKCCVEGFSVIPQQIIPATDPLLGAGGT